jgi:hypothetical protein
MAVIFNSFINDTLHKGGFDGRIIRINEVVLEIILSWPLERKKKLKYVDELFHKR